MRRLLRLIGALGALALALPAAAAPFTPEDSARIDAIAREALAESGAPSVSIAIVRDGELAFARAYGKRSLAGDAPATADDRYRIGSISKQFTAAMVLSAAGDGRLSLDDKVARFHPGLTATDRISLRQLLSHTAGYSSYFTLDVTPVEGRSPIDPRQIARRWGALPLDFEPGAQWSYSNTGYTLAGLAAEQAAGAPLDALLRTRVFDPLGMASAGDGDRRPLGPSDAVGHTRYVTAPPRPALPVGRGWLYAAGGLVMTASDLARWDMAMIDGRVLSADAWKTMRTEIKLNDGSGSGYGLGVYVDEVRGRPRVRHDGSIDGFGAENRVYPEARAAVVVLVNADYGATPYRVADGIEALLFPPPVTAAPEPPRPPRPEPTPDPAGAEEMALAKRLYAEARDGGFDRSRFTPDVDAYFSPDVVADYRASLAPLGDPPRFIQARRDTIGGLKASLYELKWPDRTLIMILRLTPDGRVAGFVVFPA